MTEIVGGYVIVVAFILALGLTLYLDPYSNPPRRKLGARMTITAALWPLVVLFIPLVVVKAIISLVKFLARTLPLIWKAAWS